MSVCHAASGAGEGVAVTDSVGGRRVPRVRRGPLAGPAAHRLPARRRLGHRRGPAADRAHQDLPGLAAAGRDRGGRAVRPPGAGQHGDQLVAAALARRAAHRGAARAGRRPTGSTSSSSATRCGGTSRRCPARQRAVLVLRFYEDLSEAQTAAHARHLGRHGEEPDLPGAAARCGSGSAPSRRAAEQARATPRPPRRPIPRPRSARRAPVAPAPQPARLRAPTPAIPAPAGGEGR